ncbi:NAD(P)-dependent oxidoreductase [Pseudonocardia sp. TRM90224]|uniref:NAD(P)-dependent oxidoreductase n=1 Tax=Pseudonocardia sp. TRM90224 TaxID=2812678 RepID=UPI001E38D5D7|nr:NAD(P)H-binding protein [Pseudonocardia sp. TRM90224]
MKIVVLGPTGGTGEQVLRQAVAAGHDVTALARRPEAVAEPGVDVRKGDVLDPASLQGVFDGADAVLSALGARSGRAPTEIYSRGIRNVRAAMAEVGVRRLVVLSAVPASRPEEKTFLERWVVHRLLHLLFGGGYDDLRRMEADLRAADDVDWTVIRPPRLLDGPATGTYRSSVDGPLRGAADIRRADLAAAMLDAVEDRALHGKVMIVAR